MKLSRFQSYIGKAKRFWIIYLSYFSVSILFLLFCRFLLTHSSIHTFTHSRIHTFSLLFSRCKDTHYFRTCKTKSADGGKFPRGQQHAHPRPRRQVLLLLHTTRSLTEPTPRPAGASDPDNRTEGGQNDRWPRREERLEKVINHDNMTI